MYLSGLCSSVTLVHRRESFRASKTMQERVLKNPKIRVLYNCGIDEIMDVTKGAVTGVRLRHVRTNELMDIPVTGVFIAIGHRPNTELFERPARLRPAATSQDQAGDRADERRRGLRLGRCAGFRLPPGDHGGGDGLHGGTRS